MQTAEDARFGELELHPDILHAIADLGYMAPTPVQAQAIPILQSGRDLLAQAQTGTGKTAAFGIPILERIDPRVRKPQALIVVPTRELAVQVTREFGGLGKYRHAREVAIYGGVGYAPQERALQRGATIIVGTPGRLLDHIERGTLDTSGLRIVILDEADRLLDMGFAPEVQRLLRKCPTDRQTALFSATLPMTVRDLARRFTKNPAQVAIHPEKQNLDAIEQVYIEVLDQDKVRALEELLKRWDMDQTLIFRHTKRGVDKLLEILKRRGHKVEAIHGDLSQRERERTLDLFRAGDLPILIATNVASRGIHIDDISHVVNFDLPEDAETFTHRVGRTGRMGKSGVAVTFVGEWDFDAFEDLRKKAKVPFRREILELYAR
ncbi:MAG: DEAD/DEAH box helicase [Candidatus Limnocylindria bacterium]|nr:DEAD/DEAH box helicase [Candidatus Limnocylindria bacterium]